MSYDLTILNDSVSSGIVRTIRTFASNSFRDTRNMPRFWLFLCLAVLGSSVIRKPPLGGNNRTPTFGYMKRVGESSLRPNANPPLARTRALAGGKNRRSVGKTRTMWVCFARCALDSLNNCCHTCGRARPRDRNSGQDEPD